MIDYDELRDLYSNKSLSRLSGNPKKIYRNGLVAMFVTSLMIGNEQKKKNEFIDNINFCKDILSNPKNYLLDKQLEKVNNFVQDSLNNIHVKNPDNKKTQDSIIDLMRMAIDYGLKDTRYLLKIKDLDHLIDLKKFFEGILKNTNPNLSYHHWIEFNLKTGLIPTFPEFITYADLVSLWNMFLDKKKSLNVELLKNNDNLKIRTINTEVHALFISAWIQGITFTESYLYYIFYNIQKGNYNIQSDKAKGYIKANMPDDNQIIDNIILSEFSNEENKNNVKHIKTLHKQYKEFNTTRNKFIHASAFEENQRSNLFPLINSKYKELHGTLETCTNLVLETDNEHF